MPVFTNTVLIRSTPEAVFDFAADPENERTWNADLESLEMITEGAPDARTAYYAKWKDTPVRVRVETVAFDRPHHLVRHNGGPLEVTATFTVEPWAEGTRFTAVFDATAHGAFKLMFPLFASKFRKDSAARLLLVRDAIERLEADRPAA